MSSFLRFIVGLSFAFGSLAAPQAAAQSNQSSAPAVVNELCAALLTAMKGGKSMGFAARRDLLAPIVERDFDLPFMTRLVVGPSWRATAPAQQSALVEAFSAYSIATYAQEFSSFSGEHFEVDPTPTLEPRGNCIVRSRLATGDPQPVELDYLMRKTGEQWRIIDVYLNGTISQMAARRSEYSTILSQHGPAGLVSLLKSKTAYLAKPAGSG